MSAENLKQVEEYEEEDSFFEDEAPVHTDTEGVWLISYADLMTLLMGFFALLTSMSTLDEQKFNAVAETVAVYVGGKVEQPFEEVAKSVKRVIEEKDLQDLVRVQVKRTSMIITFEGTLLFPSGSLLLGDKASSLMNKLAEVLGNEAGDKKILIEGHTDNVPIDRGLVASNWELSSLRANAVARLFEQYNFQKEQILTIGLGETRPLAPNADEAGSPIIANQSMNRRVVIKVANEHPF